MALLSLISARGSPGATASGLAMALVWGARRMILAECDPAGGTVLAGYLRGEVEVELGLTPLALSMLRAGHATAPASPPGRPPGNGPPEQVWGQLIDLDAPRRERLVLPGLADPAQASMVAPLWPALTSMFLQLGRGEPGFDVIADCGRLHATAHVPWPVLAASELVLLVVRSELTSLSAAVPALSLLKARLREQSGSDQTLGVLLIGDRPYSTATVARHLGVPVIATLPHDPKTAAALSRGAAYGLRSPLIRAVLGAESAIRRTISAHDAPPVRQPGGHAPGSGPAGRAGQVAQRG